MVHLGVCELKKLENCESELQSVLEILDEVGAGIAAIHVNAAIEQLASNLRAIKPILEPLEPVLLFPENNH